MTIYLGNNSPIYLLVDLDDTFIYQHKKNKKKADIPKVMVVAVINMENDEFNFDANFQSYASQWVIDECYTSIVENVNSVEEFKRIVMLRAL